MVFLGIMSGINYLQTSALSSYYCLGIIVVLVSDFGDFWISWLRFAIGKCDKKRHTDVRAKV
jgi:hypothetical protein